MIKRKKNDSGLKPLKNAGTKKVFVALSSGTRGELVDRLTPSIPLRSRTLLVSDANSANTVRSMSDALDPDYGSASSSVVLSAHDAVVGSFKDKVYVEKEPVAAKKDTKNYRSVFYSAPVEVKKIPI